MQQDRKTVAALQAALPQVGRNGECRVMEVAKRQSAVRLRLDEKLASSEHNREVCATNDLPH